MRSIAVVRGRQFVNRWRLMQQASSNNHHNIHQHQHNYWLQQLHAFSAVSDTSTDTSFHGLSLDGKKEKETTPQQHTYNPPSPPTNSSNQIIQDAQVIESDEEKQRTHESIKEIARAELSAHSISSLEDENTTLDTPYDRRLKQLNEAQLCHESIDDQCTILYAKSYMNIGELHYRLGHMQDSQEMYLNALQTLMNNTSDNNDDNADTQLMIAKCMHSLGAIHARLGEFDEAYQWYEESLKNKQQILDEAGDAAINRDIYYELGLSYNGIASLEVMKGGEVQWERALSGFQEAERNYLLVYIDIIDFQGDGSSTILTKEILEQVLPHHLASLVSVRSNMGELLRQRGQYPQAIEKFQSALDIAKISLEIIHESNNNDQIIDGPSSDEQRNKIVDIQLMIADTFMHAKLYDDAAETYEQALNSHTYFRRWNSQDDNSQRSVLPATIPDARIVEYDDMKSATSVEAAIRSNLANALSHIGQERLAEQHHTASLAIKRKFGGDHHLEVAHELMALGAVNGGPLRDFTKALTCFKEALYIFRANLEESSKVQDSSSSQVFFGDDDSAEIDKHIQNALKNISLIDAALLKDRDGGRKQISER